MKPAKQIIHIARHKPTGAKVPVVVGKMSADNVVEEHKEVLTDRKGFTITMLAKRWEMVEDDVVSLLMDFKVPGHLSYEDMKAISETMKPSDVAIFFEEYILAIEKKTNISHKKIKSKTIAAIRKQRADDELLRSK